MGTNNQELLDDPLYLGWRGQRLRGAEYDSLVDEFVLAVKEVFPNALLQWEDFANLTSFHNLETYRDVVPSFNDDIEGTAATVVAGLLAGMRLTGGTLGEQTLRHRGRRVGRHRHLRPTGRHHGRRRASPRKRPVPA